MLQRILKYLGKLIDLPGHLAAMRDHRRAPRIPTAVVIKSILVMMLTRLGSFNALEESAAARLWKKLLGRKLPSADTLGRVCQTLEADPIRRMIHAEYSRLKRLKALDPPSHGLIVAVVDGHETHATRHRCCSDCLKRTLKTKQGTVTEYYHRLVHILLVGKDLCFHLDAEPIRPGEDEVAAALRLLDRACADFPRAFDLVAGDGLYARADFFNAVLAKGKHALAVLKDEQRDLLKDARALWETMQPTVREADHVTFEMWDAEGFTTWPQCTAPTLRVVRSRETTRIKRQLTKQVEEKVSDWTWVTTAPKAQASTRAVVTMGHGRWSVENQGFNELVNRQDADHVYKHDGNAILVLWLLTSFCANLFLTFYRRNLKPALQKAYTTLAIARQILGDLTGTLPLQPRAP